MCIVILIHATIKAFFIERKLMDTSLIFVVIGLIIVFICLNAFLSRPSIPKYKLGQPLLSIAEKNFYRALELSLPEHLSLLTKVRVADILTPDIKENNKTWWSAFAQISQKHFDYVLLSVADLTPVMAIELDDKSHSSKQAIKRDALINRACQSASFPLMRVVATRDYDIGFLKASIQEYTTLHAQK